MTFGHHDALIDQHRAKLQAEARRARAVRAARTTPDRAHRNAPSRLRTRVGLSMVKVGLRLVAPPHADRRAFVRISDVRTG
jgi:hypothetical protein